MNKVWITRPRIQLKQGLKELISKDQKQHRYERLTATSQLILCLTKQVTDLVDKEGIRTSFFLVIFSHIHLTSMTAGSLQIYNEEKNVKRKTKLLNEKKRENSGGWLTVMVGWWWWLTMEVNGKG